MEFGETYEISCFMKYHTVNYANCLLLWGKVGLICLYSTSIPQAQNAVINCLGMYCFIEDVPTYSIPQFLHFPKFAAE